MKKLLVLAVVIGLMGCTSSREPANLESQYTLPAEMSDCKIYKLYKVDSTGTLTVVRCPKSETTTIEPLAKGQTSSVTVVEQ